MPSLALKHAIFLKLRFPSRLPFDNSLGVRNHTRTKSDFQDLGANRHTCCGIARLTGLGRGALPDRVHQARVGRWRPEPPMANPFLSGLIGRIDLSSKGWDSSAEGSSHGAKHGFRVSTVSAAGCPTHSPSL